jgi:hypothetical protein
MKARVSVCVNMVVLLTVLAVALGCTKAPDDAQITSNIQTRLSADSGLQGKQLSVQAANGTVTLSGVVDDENQREAAARYAASEPGVKQVVNNLQVAGAVAASTPPPAPVRTAKAPSLPKSKPTPSKARNRSSKQQKKPSVDDNASAADADQMASAAPASAPQAPAVPATPPPPPPPQKVTIPSGTTLAVRLVDSLDSETAQQSQTFHATLNSPLAVEGDVVIPAGYDVEGHVVAVQSAGKFAGKSLLTLQLDRISAGGKYYNIQTDQYKREGSSRGKNTAEKVGAGAVIGAVIGGLAGGGKGAGIGAAAGGGIGGGVQAATKGQQIKLPSETVLNFTLQGPLTVVPTSKGPNEGRPKLDQSPSSNQ